jgi:hypothetical protein
MKAGMSVAHATEGIEFDILSGAVNIIEGE